GQPAILVFRFRAQQNEVLFAAHVLPEIHERFGIPILALAGGVQPDHERIGNIGIVIFGHVHPVLMVLRGVAALQQASFGLFVFLFLFFLVLFLLGRRQRPGTAAPAWLQFLLDLPRLGTRALARLQSLLVGGRLGQWRGHFL